MNPAISRRALAALLATFLFACAGTGEEFRAQRPEQSADLPSRYPAPRRLVAIGDLHGDLAATRSALRLAGAIDGEDRWVGEDLVVVQTGDQLDRGDDELEIIDLLESLGRQARLAGGDVHVLNGNHELMNAKLDMRYVTVGGYLDFLEPPIGDPATATPQNVVDGVSARNKAMRPGGPIAMRLAQRNVVVIVGDTVFVHGGVLPQVADYGIERLNEETRQWLRKERECPPALLFPSEGPVWSRHYSDEPDESDCAMLATALERLGASRMVVGHTVQETGISSACGNKVWRIDVGLAAAYGGELGILEISDGQTRTLQKPD
ncbi:MAG: metallophosphoesterase [Thermoanaerobaculia bacterium]